MSRTTVSSVRSLDAIRAWMKSPRLNGWILGLCAVLLALRKPWALHTPQLWAEDGTIFLVQNDVVGLRAFLAPYNGYLHTFPRLIAWIASHAADVAWWPAIYNSATFVVTMAVLARMASPRLDLPGKPWLALALIVVAQSGEVLLNVTNLQWIAAFFLLQQIFITRPATLAERVGDFAFTLLSGLTGPFIIVLLPLFAWRWWRDRCGDSFASLSVAAACAGIQIWFVTTAGPPSQPPPSSFHLEMLLSTLGNRFVIWPLFGPAAVAASSVHVSAAIGCVGIVGLALWSLRPHPRRSLRAQILAAFVLFTFATVYRARPDAWSFTDLDNGDRYCYIPRVLLAWLLIWEFDARPLAVAYAARSLCLIGLLANFAHFIVPAPPDHQWAEHCDPIRRGVAANIPTLPGDWILQYPGRPSRKIPVSTTAKLKPAYSNITGEVRFQFPLDGKFPGDPLRTATPVRSWCSWDRSGQATGSIAFGPFPAPERLHFAVGGYPRETGNHLFIELVATHERIDLRPADPGERWQLLDFPVPETWLGQPILLVSIDGAATPNGWLAISEPLQK